MKKNFILFICGFVLMFLAGCVNNPPDTKPISVKTEENIIKEEAVVPPPAFMMTEEQAKQIAEKECIKGGESLSSGYYNENSKTWWFDANLNSAQEGCNPACVVNTETKTAEINWRCTGLILPQESTIDMIRALFVEKYPKYEDTLTIQIVSETDTHVRGDVIFEQGAPGGYFFATKKNGEWIMVKEGNGAIPCSLSEQGFPEDMLRDCAQ